MILKVLNENSNFFGYGNIDVPATNKGYDGEAGGYRILAESEQEWGKLTLAMANAEVAAFLREDAVLLEAAGAGFLEKAKNFFLKLWAKVKELFNKFVAFIKTYTMNDEKFLKKYEKQLNTIQSRVSNKFKYKMIPWKWKDGIISTAENGTNAMLKAIDVVIGQSNQSVALMSNKSVQKYGTNKNFVTYEKSNSDERAEALNLIRGEFLGTSSIESEDFREEILRKCCGNEDPESEEKDGDEINWNELLDIIKNGKKTIDTMSKSKKNMDTFFKKIISELDKQISDFQKNKFDGSSKSFTRQVKTTYGNRFEDKNKSDAKLFNKKYEYGDKQHFEGYQSNDKKEIQDENLRNNYRDNMSNTVSNLSENLEYAKEVASIATQGYGICIEAAKKCRAQARAILNKAIVATSSGTMASESVSYNNILDMFMQ